MSLFSRKALDLSIGQSSLSIHRTKLLLELEKDTGMARKNATIVKESALLPADRHRRIVSLVNRQGSVRAVDLAKLFGVTQETIRLDLERLEAVEYRLR